MKVKRDLTHIKMKAAGIPAGTVIQKGAWQKAKEKERAVAGEPKGTKRAGVFQKGKDDDVVKEMALEKVGGKSYPQIAEQFGVSKGIVAAKVKEQYIDSRVGRDVLKGVLLENAIAFGGQAAEKIDELNGMQSVVATGIMTQRFIDLDKHASSVPDNIDLEELAKVGRVIEELEGFVSQDVGLSDVIDI